MKFKNESEKKRILSLMKIHPAKKLEWLRQMNEFVAKFSSKKTIKIRHKLREAR